MFAVPDADGDRVANDVDVDDDNDGLIEINFLEDLDYVRHDLAGTSYDDEADDGRWKRAVQPMARRPSPTGTACEHRYQAASICAATNLVRTTSTSMRPPATAAAR